MVGSVPTFIFVWLASYLLLKPLVTAYQARRIARRRRKLKRAREDKAIADSDEQNVTVLAERQDSPHGGTVPANRGSGG